MDLTKATQPEKGTARALGSMAPVSFGHYAMLSLQLTWGRGDTCFSGRVPLISVKAKC